MASAELCSQCLFITGVPGIFRRNDISRTLQKHLRDGQTIVNTECQLGTPGTPSRWIIQLNSWQAAKKLSNEVIQEDIFLNGDQHTLRYVKPIPSEIPEKWRYFQEMMYPKISETASEMTSTAMITPDNNSQMYSHGSAMLQDPGQQFNPNASCARLFTNPQQPFHLNTSGAAMHQDRGQQFYQNTSGAEMFQSQRQQFLPNTSLTGMFQNHGQQFYPNTSWSEMFQSPRQQFHPDTSRAVMFQNLGQQFNPTTSEAEILKVQGHPPFDHNRSTRFGFRPPVDTATQSPVKPSQVPPGVQHIDNANVGSRFPPPMKSVDQTYYENKPSPSAPPYVPVHRFSTPSSYQGEENPKSQISHKNQTESEIHVSSSVPYQGQTNQFSPIAHIQGQPGQGNQFPPMPHIQGQPGQDNQFPPMPHIQGQPGQDNQFSTMTPFQGRPGQGNQFPPMPYIQGQPGQGNQFPLMANSQGQPSQGNQFSPMANVHGQPSQGNQFLPMAPLNFPPYPSHQYTATSSTPGLFNQNFPAQVNPLNQYGNIPGSGQRPGFPVDHPSPLQYPRIPSNSPMHLSNDCFRQGYGPNQYPLSIQEQVPGPIMPGNQHAEYEQARFNEGVRTTVEDNIHERDKRRESYKDQEEVSEENERVLKSSKDSRKWHKSQQKKESFPQQAEDRLSDSEPEEDELTAIRVDGVSDISSKETLQMYFENKRRSGGGEIESIWSDCLDDDVLFIQFKEASDANAVLRRSHTFENRKLKISICAPIQYYNDKVLIENMNQTTTEECLSNFLEVKADCIATDIDFGHANNAGKALVSMEAPIDMQKLEKACTIHKLEGATVTVSRVPVSNCILVTSLTPDIHADIIQLYFENNRKSGGGPVEKVKLNDDKTACLVYFVNFRDIDNVIKRMHTLSNVRLKVEHFQPCFGQPECFTSKSVMEIPGDLTLKNVNPHKMSLLRRSERVCNEFQQKLSTLNASVNIHADEDVITISYKGEQPSKNELALVDNWEQKVSVIYTKFIDEITVNVTNVSSPDWKKTIQSLQGINIENPDLVIVEVDSNAKTITVTGIRIEVSALIKRMEEIKHETTETSDVNERISKETVTALKPIEYRMLHLVGFIQEMVETYLSMKVSFDDDYRWITFEGNAGDINAAKVKMYETRNSFGTANLKYPDSLFLQLYKSEQTKDYVSKIFQDRQLKCLYEVTDDSIIVYSEYKTDIDKCVAAIRKAVGYHCVHKTKEDKEYFGTRMCTQKIESLQHCYEGKVLIELNAEDFYVKIYALENVLEDIVDEIEDDFNKNASLQKKVNCSIYEATFIGKYKKADISAIEQNFNEYRIKIEPKRSGFLVQGSEEGASKAIEQLQEILKSIKRKNHCFKKKSFSLSITSEKGLKQLIKIERDLSCLIATKESSDDKLTSLHSPYLNLFASCRIPDKVLIQTIKCDITETEVSMIVNSTDDEMTMRHGLGKSLAIKGGREVKDACSDFIARNGKLRECQIYVGPAGNLHTDHILHLSVPKYRRGDGEDDKLYTAILNCLCEADDYKSDSVAFPAVGCGAARYPVWKATDIIVSAIEKFYSSNHQRAITKIILCDMKAENVEEFTRALTDHFGRKNVQVMKKDEKENERDLSRRKQDTKHKGYSRRRTASENIDKVLLGSITVSVVKGLVAKQKCDAIMNIVDKTLDLKRGTISATLLNNGGAELQQELHTQCPNGLEYGQIAVTSGKKLSSQFVIHARLRPWNGANKDSSKESLQTFLNECLRGADKQKVSCVVFPAIGTGKLGYPKEIVAKEMFVAIAQFSKDNQQTAIKEIRIVIYPDDTITLEAFENESSFWETGERHDPRDLRSVYLDEDTERNFENEKERKGTRKGQIGSLGIAIKLGNILDEDVDSIVLSIPKSLDLDKGAVSREMYKRSGDEVKTQLEKKKEWLRKYDLVTTSAPNLQCKGLIHVATQDKTDGWKYVIEKSLKKAEEKQWTSVAFPALGTSYRIKPEAIAECMVAAFKSFEKTKPRCVSDLKLVIYQREMLHVFNDAVFSAQEQFQGNDGAEQHRHMIKPSSDPDCITFTILASEYSVIDRAILKIDECYDQKDFHDDIIKSFTRYHKDRFKELERQENVTVNFDKDKGMIQIYGLKDDVTTASEKVHSIMRDALKFDKNKSSADMMSNIVQWYYTDTGSTQLVPYDKPINFKIEKAYKADEPFVSFKDAKQDMLTIDFKKLIVYPVEKPNESTKVERKDLIKAVTANIPSTWAPMTSNLSLVALANTDPEYKATENTFIKSIGNATVVKIERVQNKALWQQYQAKKQQMEMSNPPNTKNESLLWHGSSSVGIDNILVHGFDRSYSNMGCSIGMGVYFSPMATVSHGFSRPDATGIRRMFHCRVLTGEFTLGQSTIRYPPPKPSGGPQAKYDSVVNNMNAPTEFVIFNDTQAYPEYLISFK